jgi:hypothetical protein
MGGGGGSLTLGGGTGMGGTGLILMGGGLGDRLFRRWRWGQGQDGNFLCDRGAWS